MQPDTLYLVDGSNFLFRAYHALPPLTTKAGVPVGAVYGFTQMMIRLETEQRPGFLAVVFDKGSHSFRNELYTEYKAHRPEPPDDLRPQFGLTRKMVETLGITVLEPEGFEADDLIATLAARAKAEGLRVVVVSSDKDLMQLVDDKCVLLDTMRNVTYTDKEVVEKFGVPPAQLGDVLALMGDAVDGVPGVPGVGPKTASALIAEYGSLDALFAKLPELALSKTIRGAKGLAEKLAAHVEQVRLSRKLVALDFNVPSTVELASLKRHAPDFDRMAPLFRELEFERLLERMRPQAGKNAGASTGTSASTSTSESAAASMVALPSHGAPPEIVLSADALAALASTLADAKDVGLAIAWVGNPYAGGAIVGFALSDGAHTCYVPIGHRYLGVPGQLPIASVVSALRPVLQAGPNKYVYDWKTLQLLLQPLGVTLAPLKSDVMIASYLLDAADGHELPAIAERTIGAQITEVGDLVGSGKKTIALDTIEIAAVAKVVALSAEATLAAGRVLEARLDAAGQHKLMHELELPLSTVLARMEQRGIVLDVEQLHKMGRELDEKLIVLESEVRAFAGGDINLGSPKQLQELLFEKLQLPAVRRTKTGLSTDADVLEELSLLHPAPAKILEHRTLSKLKNTYVDALPQAVDAKTGRLHTSYKQTIAATGRLSSTEPNLQNIPIRTELGRRIRYAFVAPPGSQLVVGDYSQIELRVLAHMAEDRVLIDAFSRDEDIHQRTVREMFGPEKEKDKELRSVAKMINYGIVYGLSDFGLAQRLGIDRASAKKYIEGYLRTYAGVQRYMNSLVEVAQREGGARTIMGRFRPIAELAQKNRMVRSYGERIAKNTPIQGSAADILKLAMIEVDRRLAADFPQATMLLTVHDELVLEAPTAIAADVARVLKETMENVLTLRVPLRVDVGVGACWAEAK